MLTEEQKKLVEDHVHLIPGGCSLFRCYACKIDDPQGVAALGLIEAAETWREGRGSAFRSWASIKIRSHLRTEWKKTQSGKYKKFWDVQLMMDRATYHYQIDSRDRGHDVDPSPLARDEAFPWALWEWLKTLTYNDRERLVLEYLRMGYTAPGMVEKTGLTFAVAHQVVSTIRMRIRKELAHAGKF